MKSETGVSAIWRMRKCRLRLEGFTESDKVSLTGNSWYDPLTGERAENNITTLPQTQTQNPDSIEISPVKDLP